jgi:general secretion pathway protein G
LHFLRICRDRRGLTLLELVLTVAILSILAAAVLPMAEVAVKRTKELELRRTLRTVRTAIDDYKADHKRAAEEKKIITSINETGYPKELEDLLKGNDWGGLYSYKKKYLRRIPKDPFDSYEQGWGMRSLADEPDSTVWGGEDVFDIYSQSDGFGLDGTPYNTW